MKLNKWKVREALSVKIFLVVIVLTTLITFGSKAFLQLNNIKYIAMGLTNASLLVLLFTNAMNMIETKNFTPKKVMNFVANLFMFAMLFYIFVFKLS